MNMSVPSKTVVIYCKMLHFNVSYLRRCVWLGSFSLGFLFEYLTGITLLRDIYLYIMAIVESHTKSLSDEPLSFSLVRSIVQWACHAPISRKHFTPDLWGNTCQYVAKEGIYSAMKLTIESLPSQALISHHREPTSSSGIRSRSTWKINVNPAYQLFSASHDEMVDPRY